MLSVDDLRTLIGVLPSDDTDDGLLERLEAAAVADFQRETNRYFGPVTEIVETLHGGSRGRPYLRLRAPLTSLTKVEMLGGFTSFLLSWQEPYPPIDYTYDAVRGTLYLINAAVFPAGHENIRVTYQGGYAAGSEPADVRDEIANRVAQAYRRRPSASPVVLEPGQQSAQPAGARSSRAAGYYRNPGL